MPNPKKTQDVLLRLPWELVAGIDSHLADRDMKRTAWMRRALRRQLKQEIEAGLIW